MKTSISLLVIGLFMVQTMVAQNTQKLKFVDFALGDTETYIFQDADENYVYFDGCNAENDFAYELSEEDADEDNQGWGPNPDLQNKWFMISWTEEERELYEGGELEKVKIIQKIAALE